MSRCCRKETVTTAAPMIMPRPVNNCICSFPTLIMLILIVLQFTRRCCNVGEDGEGESGYVGGLDQQVGNGILFIIAFYFLACAGCGRAEGYGAY